MPIRVDFLSNTRSITRDVQSLGTTFDGLGDALSDVADDARRSGTQIGDSLTDTGRDAERSAERMERAFREATEATTRATDEQTRDLRRYHAQQATDVESSTRRGSERSRESIRELGSEARQNASETFSSFDGSAQSFADGIQGTFGGIVSSLGPIGAAAGAAGAIGIGLISSAIQKGQEQAEALKQKIGEMTTSMIDAGKTGSLSMSYVVDQMKELASQTDTSQDSLVSLRKEAEKAGVSVKDYQLANAGAAKQTKAALKEARDEYQKLSDKISDQGGVASKAENAKRTALGQTIGKLLEVQQAQKDAAQSAKDYFKSGAADIEQAGAAASSYAEAVQSAFSEAGSNIDDYVEKGKFDLDGYEDAMNKSAQAIVDYQSNMSTAVASLGKSGHDAAIQYLESLGPDAAPLIAAFIDAPQAQKSRLAKTWDTLGQAASTSFGTSLQTDLDAQTPTQLVKLTGDDSDIQRKLAAIAQKTLTVSIGANIPDNLYLKRLK